MKKCIKCELNYVKNDADELCEICKKEILNNSKGSNLDSNKTEVEKYLLPFLKALPQEKLELFLKKEKSFELFKLRLPLLIRCKNIDKEHCRKETIVDNSTTSRYYITPYLINGEYYHICSQWADCGIEESKNCLKMVKNAMLKK